MRRSNGTSRLQYQWIITKFLRNNTSQVFNFF